MEFETLYMEKVAARNRYEVLTDKLRTALALPNSSVSFRIYSIFAVIVLCTGRSFMSVKSGLAGIVYLSPLDRRPVFPALSTK